MKADAVSFLEDFIRKSVGSQYVIPVYQRNYTWKKSEQVNKLLSDIERIMSNPEKKHFIGTIVYVVTKDGLTGQERSVVDGQQRLTTIFLTLYAMKTIAKERGNQEVVNVLTDWYLENNSSNEKYKLRLKPLVADDTVFAHIAHGDIDEIEEKESNVYINFEYIKSAISKWLDSGKSYDDIIMAMRNLYVVYIILEKDDNPQQIFESINSTGMELTAADLIRNYIMMNKPNDEQENVYLNVWKKLEDIFFNSKKLEAFFRFYLASKKYTLSAQKRLYDEFQVYWNAEKATNGEEAILSDIINYAKHYKRLYLAKDEDALGESLYDFRKLSSDMVAPFAMELLELLRKNEINNEQVRCVLGLINTYLVRRHMMGLDTSDITRFFPTYLKNVLDTLKESKTEFFVDICIKCLVVDNRQKKSFMPDDEQLKTYLMTANAYSLTHTRWLLEKIEAKGNSVGVITQNLSIEHIMPQKRSEYWAEVMGIEQDKYDQYVNRIGNLTLVSQSDNSSMSNKDFSTKKEKLSATSHIVMNQYILGKEHWNIDDINERSSILIDSILAIFPYAKPTMIFAERKEAINITRQGEVIATGFVLADKTVILNSGSQIVWDNSPYHTAVQEMRDSLFDNDAITENDAKYILQEDQYLSSLSFAANFVLGGNQSGWYTWRDSEGTILGESKLVSKLVE